MSKSIQNSREPNHPSVEAPTNGDPNVKREAAHQLHARRLAGGVYMAALRPAIEKMFGDFDLGPSAMLFADELIERMAPRDPLEEMLVVQALMAHVRVLHLTARANMQETLKATETLNGYADKASNTFRRQMLALAEYRKPPKTTIGQANIAQQQVVMNGGSANGDATNEQGCGGSASEPTPSELHAQPGGAGVAPGGERQDTAVEEVNGAKDA